MSNMSYAMFQNTQSDMQDCLESLDGDKHFSSLSKDEQRAARGMLNTAHRLVEILQQQIDENDESLNEPPELD